MKAPRVLISCGPAYEPIDAVRRLTNHSTGELGKVLAEALSSHGFDVRCFCGDGATYRSSSVPVETFGTNASLQKLLEREAGNAEVVLHVAALCDFGIANSQPNIKLPSSEAQPPLILQPLPKVISHLRSLFPCAVIVGWKYEVNGTRADALKAGFNQIEKNSITACVVNGPAYGPGFGLLESPSLPPRHFEDKASLSQALGPWLSER